MYNNGILVTDYARHKLACEAIVNRYSDTPLCCVTLRPATLCGRSPRQRLDLLLNRMVTEAVCSGTIQVPLRSKQRPILPLSELVALITYILACQPDCVRGRIFNVAFDNRSVAEWADIARQAADGARIVHSDESEFDGRSYIVVSGRLQRETGFVPSVTISDSLRELVLSLTTGEYENPTYEPRWSNLATQQQHDFAAPISAADDVMSKLINFRPLSAFRRPGRNVLCVFRSASLDGIVPDLALCLRERLDIGNYVDLHHSEEEQRENNFAASLHGVGMRLLCVPIKGNVPSPRTAHPTAEEYADYYAAILDTCAGALAATFHAVAHAMPHGVVFACRQGKDRTGLLAAALQEAAEVPRQDILLDFARSGPALARVAGTFRTSWEKRDLAPQDYLRRYRLGAAPLELLFARPGGGPRPLLNRLLPMVPPLLDMDAAIRALECFRSNA